MSRIAAGKLIYSSTFDQDTGMIMRLLPDIEDSATLAALMIESEGGIPSDSDKYVGVTNVICPASPSPETVDVCITQRCGFGCSFCYQDSTADRDHAPMELIEAILEAFTPKPYQIAYGGGSPTTHPQFCEILKMTREAGIIPNYTTEGAVFTKAVVEATNAYCGGVSITYHSWKGEEWFAKQYKKFHDVIHTKKNIHLIFDKDVAKNLSFLISLQDTIGEPLSIILLAYYEDVGRGDPALLPSRRTMDIDFPVAAKTAIEKGMSIAFSEGLLPYFLQRGIVDTSQAVASEGRYACYINEWGMMRKSSFTKVDWQDALRLIRPESYQFDPASFQKHRDSHIDRSKFYETGVLGTIVKNPSPEFLEYARAAIVRAGNNAKWLPAWHNNYDDAVSVIDVKEEDIPVGLIWDGLDANKLWAEMRMDTTHDTGHTKYGGGEPDSMGCRNCKDEWRCSKNSTSETHLLMCKTVR